MFPRFFVLRTCLLHRIVFASAVAVAVYAIEPAGVAATNDDFGYFRSVVATLQRGRPWTDDWLEPWASGLSVLSAGIWAVTGSFTAATHGLLAVLAGVSGWFVWQQLRAWGLSSGACWLCGAGAMTVAPVLAKAVEFTSVALSLPCLLGSLWAARRERWLWFAGFWTLALSTRQSAVARGVMPAAAWLTAWRAGRPGWTSLGVLGAGVVVWWLSEHGMNETFAQRVVTQQIWRQLSVARVGSGVGAALWVWLVAAGLGGWLASRSRGAGTRSVGWRVGALVILLVGWIWLMPVVKAEHLTRPPAMVGLAGVGLLVWSAWGWGCAWRPCWVTALTAAGAGLLVGLRGDLWDYYLIDVGALGLFGVCRVERESEPGSKIGWGLVIPAVVLAAQVVIALDLKAAGDRAWMLCKASERALRAGKLAPEELSYAPFGYLAWQVFPYFIESAEGRGASRLDAFGAYLRTGAVEVGQGYSGMLKGLSRYRHVPPGDRTHLIESVGGRFLWFFRGEFYLLRVPECANQPAPWGIDGSRYARPVFPLSDAEWTALLQGRLDAFGRIIVNKPG